MCASGVSVPLAEADTIRGRTQNPCLSQRSQDTHCSDFRLLFAKRFKFISGKIGNIIPKLWWYNLHSLQRQLSQVLLVEIFPAYADRHNPPGQRTSRLDQFNEAP